MQNISKLLLILVVTVSLSACSLWKNQDTSDSVEQISADHPELATNTNVSIMLPAPRCQSNIPNMPEDRWGWYRGQDLMKADTNCSDGSGALCLHVGEATEGWYASEQGELLDGRPCATENRFALYFVRNDVEEGKCATVPPTKATLYRETSGKNVFEKVLNMLLVGPGLDQANMTTKIPSGTKLLSADYENGTVTVNFSSAFNATADECTMKQRKSQIEKTIKYVTAVTNQVVRKIVIEVEGEEVNW